jgi:hypothetical protein
MVQHEQSQVLSEDFDPSGSIFLPKTTSPVREFSQLELGILLRRGPHVSLDTSLEEQIALYEELCKVRAWYMGKRAIDAIAP